MNTISKEEFEKFIENLINDIQSDSKESDEMDAEWKKGAAHAAKIIKNYVIETLLY